PAIQSKYRLTRLALVTDAKDKGGETDHIEGAINPDAKTPSRKKTPKDGTTNIKVVRSTFTIQTKWDLMEADPNFESHKMLVKGRGPRLRKSLDRRHVVSSQTMAAHYESVLNGAKLWSVSKKILEDHNVKVSAQNNESIQEAAQNRHKVFFNDI